MKTGLSQPAGLMKGTTNPDLANGLMRHGCDSHKVEG